MVIIPVILCGGAGKRLWPLSTPEKPKPFLKIDSRPSLFQQTLLRCRTELFHASPIIAANARNRTIVSEQLVDLGMTADLLWEPAARNSCPAIALACFHALARFDDPVLLVQASDHVIESGDEFIESIQSALPFIDDYLVTFGIEATHCETGYGYISCNRLIDPLRSKNCYKVIHFLEKPSVERAKIFVDEGYLWNSGNFLFKANLFLDELRRWNPELFASLSKVFSSSRQMKDGRIFDACQFETLPNVSVDDQVFQLTDKAAVATVRYKWRDIGSWRSLSKYLYDDLDNGDPSLRPVQSVSEPMAGFNETGPVSVKKPWGGFDSLGRGQSYQVKRLEVAPGQVLSLQTHRYRSEHWIIVEGSAEITLEENVFTYGKDEHIHIPVGAVHRIANNRPVPLVLIEIQIGDYLGEDDIIRLDDIYDRIT